MSAKRDSRIVAVWDHTGTPGHSRWGWDVRKCDVSTTGECLFIIKNGAAPSRKVAREQAKAAAARIKAAWAMLNEGSD
jgi:hypothetical protein